MNCHQCGAVLPEGAMFCPECGTKAVQQPKMQPMSAICPVCGNKNEPGSLFCEKCGNRLQAQASASVPPQTEKTNEPAWTNPTSPMRDPFANTSPIPQKKENGGLMKGLIITICILCALLVAGLGALGVKVFILDKNKEETTPIESTNAVDQNVSETTAADETQEEAGLSPYGERSVINTPNENDIAAMASQNLFQNRQVSLKGTMEENDGVRVLKMNECLGAYGAGSNGQAVLVNADYALFNTKNAKVTKEQLEAVPVGTEVAVNGNMSIINDELVIFPDSIGDSSTAVETIYTDFATPTAKPAATATPVPTATPAPTPTTPPKSEYILEKSSTDYLVDSDVKNLTLQELNYAKNEIYARHGRKFKSPELQKYFSSKSWYNGTVDPDRFSESVFSKVELANIKFLAAKEYAINPNGYPLDKK